MESGVGRRQPKCGNGVADGISGDRAEEGIERFGRENGLGAALVDRKDGSHAGASCGGIPVGHGERGAVSKDVILRTVGEDREEDPSFRRHQEKGFVVADERRACGKQEQQTENPERIVSASIGAKAL